MFHVSGRALIAAAAVIAPSATGGVAQAQTEVLTGRVGLARLMSPGSVSAPSRWPPTPPRGSAPKMTLGRPTSTPPLAPYGCRSAAWQRPLSRPSSGPPASRPPTPMEARRMPPHDRQPAADHRSRPGSGYGGVRGRLTGAQLVGRRRRRSPQRRDASALRSDRPGGECGQRSSDRHSAADRAQRGNPTGDASTGGESLTRRALHVQAAAGHGAPSGRRGRRSPPRWATTTWRPNGSSLEPQRERGSLGWCYRGPQPRRVSSGQ
jgi:hypothetical protein